MRTWFRTAVGAVVLGAATPAHAVEHEVFIERKGFFPITVHVAPGDTIRYVNKAPNWVRLFSEDAYDNLTGYDSGDPCKIDQSSGDALFDGDLDGWDTDWIPVNGEFVVSVTSCMETTVTAPQVYNTSYNSNTFRGYLSFDLPALGN